MTATETQEFERILVRASPEVAGLAAAARALILALDPRVVQVVWERQGIAGFGIGPKKMSEHYVYLAPQPKHLNVGFYHGAELPDPGSLLEGTGKLLRHVKVTSMDAIRAPRLRELIKAARAERAAALARD